MTAMPVVNIIPPCEATPRLKRPLEIPRFWSRNIGVRREAEAYD
jgi:hypothetical protein